MPFGFGLIYTFQPWNITIEVYSHLFQTTHYATYVVSGIRYYSTLTDSYSTEQELHFVESRPSLQSSVSSLLKV